MKNLNLIVWVTQLGLSVAFPLVGFILLAVWLQEKFRLGSWVLWIGIVIGICSAINGLRFSLKTMERLSEDRRKEHPPVSFNDHD